MPFQSEEQISPDQAAINEEDDLLGQYSPIDESLSDGLNTQDGANEDQTQLELLQDVAEKSDPEFDPELANLGQERAISKYGLRQRPTRNRKYFNTEFITDYKNNL